MSGNAESKKVPETLEFNQCQDAVRKLNDYLSHELRPDEEGAVQHHLRQCRGCFAKFHFEETLLRTIRERAAQVRAPGMLRDKILDLLHRDDGNAVGTVTEEARKSNAPPSSGGLSAL